MCTRTHTTQRTRKVCCRAPPRCGVSQYVVRHRCHAINATTDSHSGARVGSRTSLVQVPALPITHTTPPAPPPPPPPPPPPHSAQAHVAPPPLTPPHTTHPHRPTYPPTLANHTPYPSPPPIYMRTRHMPKLNTVAYPPASHAPDAIVRKHTRVFDRCCDRTRA